MLCLVKATITLQALGTAAPIGDVTLSVDVSFSIMSNQVVKAWFPTVRVAHVGKQLISCNLRASGGV